MSAQYRDAAERAETIDQFALVVRDMLAHLKDMHVWIELPGGERLYPYASRHQANYDYQVVTSQLKSVQRFGRLGFIGRTEEGYGVVVINSLPAESDVLYSTLIDALKGMFDAPRFIVDLRSNGGGAEPRAAQIASLFADKKYLYARSKIRSGANVDEFRETPARYIAPSLTEPFDRPVICLVGPGCVSSGEGFALMMKAMEHVTLVGQPTRGASGNPRPITLSNGIKVWFSRWVSMEPDGASIEGRGIQPDIVVEHADEGDPTFDKAIELLRSK